MNSCPIPNGNCLHRDVDGNCRLSECLYLKGGLLNSTHYSRDNIPKLPAKYKVGDKVKFTLNTEVLAIHNGCDGTVLYELEEVGRGWSEEHLEQ